MEFEWNDDNVPSKSLSFKKSNHDFEDGPKPAPPVQELRQSCVGRFIGILWIFVVDTLSRLLTIV